LTLNNSIVANSTSGGDISGDYTGSDNLTGTVTLGDLGYYGGPTPTMALLPGSPAIGGVPANTSGTPATDQRGFSRDTTAATDIGAYQSQANPFLVTTAADPGGLTGQLSLREAINLANAYENAGDSAAITFAAAVAGQTITLTQGQLELTAGTGTTSIDGGAAGITVDANKASRIFQVDSGAQAALTNLTLTHGRKPGQAGGAVVNNGGAIYNGGTLTVKNSTLSGNFALGGGGIDNDIGGTLTVSDSTLSGNSAVFFGGGIENRGTLTVSDCTLSGNFTIQTQSGYGGGIDNFTGGTLTVSNSTLSGNYSGLSGGGISNFGTLTVSNSTLSGNYITDTRFGSGGGIYNFGTLTLNNNIVANSTSGGDISGSYTGSHNLTGTVTLGDLADNGGPTQTMALLPGSTGALGGVPANTLGTPSADQRGFLRNTAAATDIGAYQTQPISITTASLSGGMYGTAYTPTTLTATEAGFSSFTFAVTSGALPDGLTLASDGTLSGTPSAANSFSFTVTATDRNGFTASQAYTLTIAKATPAVSVNPVNITYGTALANGQLSGTASAAGTFTYTSASAPGMVLSPGNNQSEAVTFTPTDSTDYNPVSTTVTVNVARATLTVTADNKSRYYGAANPTLTYGITGFVNSDPASVVSGTPALSTTATAGSAPGPYAIAVDVSPLSAANYTFQPANGTLTVTKAPLSAAGGYTFGATAGAPFGSTTVATFTTPDLYDGAAAFAAVIAWGDGSTSNGVITGSNGSFTITGSHTYADPVNESVSVQISHKLGYTATATVNDTATVTGLGQGVVHGLTGGIGF
jgi:hypothetical protein